MSSREVLSVIRGVLEQFDVESALRTTVLGARELTGARYGAIGVLDPTRTQLARFLPSGIDEATREGLGSLPSGRGLLGELIRHPEPLRIDDIAAHPSSCGFPPGHPPMRTFLGVPLTVRGRPYAHLYLAEKSGGAPFDADDEEAVVLLADFAGLAVDHAQRLSLAESERYALQQNVGALDATMQIARALGGQTDLTTILQLVAKRGRALVSARVLIIELLRGEELELAAGAGEVPGDLVGRRVPLDSTVASAALGAGRTQRLSEQSIHDRWDRHGFGHLGLSAQDGLILPLIFRDRAYGALVVLDSLDGAPFTREDQRLLEAFAASAATAVATATSAADERRRQSLAAAEAERARWARELHDDMLQALGNLRLMLSGARRRGDPAAISDAVDQAVQQLEVDIAALRALITELRPAALDQLGLQPALLALVDRFGASGLEIDAHIDLATEHGGESARLVPDLETAVYRIVQEALTNTVKHARAERAVVEVVEEQGRVRVTVRDDGVGFDPEVLSNGFGLLGMRERAELLGGRIDVRSAPDRGVTLSTMLPAVHGPHTGDGRDPRPATTPVP